MPALLVKDFMSKKVVSFTNETSIAVAVHSLLQSHQIGAPVINEHKQVIGWISEQDCLDKMLKSSYHCDETALVGDIKNEQVLSVSPQDNVLDLANKMLGQKPKTYPVVEDGKLIGIIARRDILNAVDQHLSSCYPHK